MGSGTSQLSPEDSAVLTNLLKDEYSVLQREGHTEQEIQEKLAVKYNEIIGSMNETGSSTQVTGEWDTENDVSAGPGSGGGEQGTRSFQRRTLHGNDRASDAPEVLELLRSARQGYVEDCETMLNRAQRLGQSIIECTSTEDDNRQTALMLACEYGHIKVVSLLIERNADLETRDKNGETAMHYCTSNGHLEVVKLMVKRGANKEAKNYNGYNPLMMAADFNHLEIVRFLLYVGADLEAVNHRGCSALVYAADNGNIEVAEYLIKQGSDIEVRSNIGFTPLIYACQRGHLEMATLLADGGANIEAANNFGQTPLIIAAHHGHANIVTFLVDRGADIDKQNNDGLTALDLSRDEDMEELLITLKRIVTADPEDRW